MKLFAATTLLIATLCATASAQVRRHGTVSEEDGIYSRTVIHSAKPGRPETRTVSKQDLNNQVREKRTLDHNGILLMKSIFQLGANGKPINGLVYDGRGRLLYRSEFSYDNASQLQEERVFAADGRPVRRLIYKKDRFGKMKPFAISFADGRGGFGTARSNTDIADYSTDSPHAYSPPTGVQNTPGAYRPQAPKPATSSRTKKRERRFQIFKRR